ncbi:MAG TPA: hypothetical protein VHZ29_13800, partial [Rhizomicrobium sp.]|nr:hypothetical protein [Rhizomicrobium sp.]
SLARAGLESHDRQARVPLGHGPADACLKGGVQRGALHEVFAHPGHETAATGFAASLCARLAVCKPVLWIRQDYCALEFGELAATGLLELGIDPSCLLLLCVAHAEDALRAASDALTCKELGAVVIELSGEPRILDLTASRRLTLACAQTNVTAFLLRFAAQPDASSAETRWRIRGAPSPRDEGWGQPIFEAELVRNRHGSTGRWVMEWSCDDGLFRESRESTSDRGAVVPAPFDRPAAAAAQQGSRSAA